MSIWLIRYEKKKNMSEIIFNPRQLSFKLAEMMCKIMQVLNDLGAGVREVIYSFLIRSLFLKMKHD